MDRDAPWGVLQLEPRNDGWLQSCADRFAPVCFSVSGQIAYPCEVSADRCTAAESLRITGSIQLHNREDLRRELGSDPSACSSDRQLVLAAYQKWGDKCAEHLLGEFSFAIWDDIQRKLFCCRDPIGLRAFLYWTSGARFVFSDRIETILHCPGVPRQLNRRKLAALSVPTAFEAAHQETFHAGILALPPGTIGIADRNGLRISSYWKPCPSSTGITFRSAEDVHEQLRALLFEAVACRIPASSPVVSSLSGGLDSSSLTAIAATLLAKKNRSMTAVAAVVPDQRAATFPDEREFVEEFRAFPNVGLSFVAAEGAGPFDVLRCPEEFLECPLRHSRHFLNLACERAALQAGADSMMWGFGGELGATAWSERCFLELALRFRWAELKEASAGAAYSVFRLVASQFYSAVAPRRGWKPMVLLSEQFQRECVDQPTFSGRFFSERSYRLGLFNYWWSKHATERGQPINVVRTVTPLVDQRVIEFCLNLPASLSQKDGLTRYPIRAALRGILPEKIRLRRDKKVFCPDYFYRYNEQLPIARDFVASIGPRDPVRSVIDIARVEERLKPADVFRGSFAALVEVPVTLYVVNFLRQFSEFRA